MTGTNQHRTGSRLHETEKMKNTWEEKLRALLEGLETQHIDLLMKYATTEDYRSYGKLYAINNLQNGTLR